MRAFSRFLPDGWASAYRAGGGFDLAVTGGGLVRILLVEVVTPTLIWVVLVAALAIAVPDGATVADAVHLLPDVLRLVRRLAGIPPCHEQQE